MNTPSPLHRMLIALVALLVAPLVSLHAADPPKPAAEVTQKLLNSIHITAKLIFDPFPAYEQEFLPFAMAASMESTSKGRLWTCWAGGKDGPNAYLLASYSDDQGRSWRDPVFVIDPQARGLKMGTRLGSFWCDPRGRLWLFFHQSCGILIDLGAAVSVTKINVYSWHSRMNRGFPEDRRQAHRERAAQNYVLYGHAGNEPPGVGADPARSG